jgi:hypothetical protein
MIKKLLYTILVLIALSYGAWKLANSEWTFSYLLDQANTVLEKDQLKLQYDGYDGALLSSFSLEKLTLVNTQNEEPFISIKSVVVATNPFLLLGDQPTFNSLSIGSVNGAIDQDSTNVLWQFITKERSPTSGLPAFKLEKLILGESNLAFKAHSFALLLSEFSFDIGASYSANQGFELSLPIAEGKLAYNSLTDSTQNTSWAFSLSAGSDYNPLGQLLIQKQGDNNINTLRYPQPQLIQAKLDKDTLAIAGIRLNTTAEFINKSQLSIELPLIVDMAKQELEFCEDGLISWVNPSGAFQLTDSLSIPDVGLINLRNTSAIKLSSGGILVDTASYSLTIEGIKGTAYGIQDLNINAEGSYNFSQNTSIHKLAILSEGWPNSPLNITAETSFRSPIIYGKIQSVSTQNLAINDFLEQPLDVDFRLNGWQWAQDLNYNINDDFFEGSLKIELPKSSLNTVQFNSFLINGRYSAIGANMDILAKSEAGNIGVQVFGVHFEDAVEHELKIDFQELDLGKWIDVDGFTTKLSATGNIIGSGMNPLQTESAIDFYFKESFIQNAKIDTARLTASIANGYLAVDQLALKSDLAVGLFNAGVNLNEIFSPNNTLEGFLELKNPTSLAPLFGLDTLNATGFLTAKISPDVTGNINLVSSFDINNLRVGYNQEIGQIDGVVRIPMQKEPTLEATFNAYNATLSNIKLSNITNSITAKLGVDSISGSSQSRFKNGDDYSANITTHFAHQNNSSFSSVTLDTIIIRHNRDSLQLEQPSTIKFTENRIQLSPIFLINKESSSSVALAFEQDSEQISGFFKANSFDLYKAQQCFLVEQPFHGTITTDINWNGTKDKLFIAGPFNFQNIAFEDIFVPRIEGQFSMDNSFIDFRTSMYSSISDSLKLAELSLQTNLSQLDSIAIDLIIPQNPIKNWRTINPLVSNNFRANMQAKAHISGAISSPKIDGFVQLNNLRDAGNTFADSLLVRFKQNGNESRFTLNGSVFLLAKKAFELSVESPVLGYHKEYAETDENPIYPFSADSTLSIDLSATDFDLKFLNSLKPINEQLNISKGFLNTKLYAAGKLDELFPKGNLTIDQLDISWLKAGVTHQASYLSMALDRNKITVENALLRGDQGSMKAEGTWIISSTELINDPISLSVKFDNFLSLNKSIGRFRTNGSLGFSGTSSAPKLNGKLQVSRGKIIIDALENRDIEDVQLNEEDTLSYFDLNNWLNNLESALEVSVTEDVSVRNKSYPRVEIYPKGKLNIVKAKGQEDWQVYGGLLATRGSIDLLGKRFQLEDSRVDFDGNPMNPNLSIEAMYRIPKPHEVSIWYLVEGRLSEPTFSYRSNPEMELQNMISYLLFNKPFYALESWEQSLAATDQNAGGSASNIAIQLLTNRIEQLAAQRLGIDLVQIDNTRTGSRNATTLKTGWYLNNKTFFAIMNELGVTNPQTQFILEYLVGRDLNLILTQTNDDGTRLDLRWRYDY